MPFQKGQIANPYGRPHKEYSVVEVMKKILHSKPEIKQALCGKLFQIAVGGDVAAIKLILAYTDGVPTDTELFERLELIEQRLGEMEEHANKSTA